MLYLRVQKVIEMNGLSRAKCAEGFRIDPKTLASYLTEEKQGGLYEYLPLLLEWYPRLSRQWLFFGEGPMHIGFGVPLNKPVPLRTIAEAVGQMAEDAGGTEAEVLRYIAGIPIPEESNADSALLEENQLLTQKVIQLQEELNKAKDEIINLYKAQERGQNIADPAPTEHIAAQ